MKMNRTYLLVFALGCLAAPGAADDPLPYAWPTDASRMLTSTFGEYRGHRFHAGMDIKTFGQVGFKALAVRPGSVSRVEVSPWGYGRVVYLLLDTGETAVYGHLQKFSPEIARRVQQEQQRSGRYAVELRFAPNEIPVEQGDIIGWTGQSGSGAPHLHFELRNESEDPLNPLLKGYEVKDTIAPAVRKVLVIPLDATARVAGDLKPAVYLPRPVQPGRLRIAETIPVFGRIAFAADFIDQIDGTHNKMNPHRYRLLVDEKEVFAASYDRYPYAIDHHADLDRDYRALMRNKDLYQRLFREAGNALPFYAGDEPWYGALECDPASSTRGWLSSITQALGFFWELPSGITPLERGIHPFRIEVYDFNSNRTLVEGRLQVGPPELLPANATDGVPLEKSAFSIQADYFDDYVRILVSSTQPIRRAPALTIFYGEEYRDSIPLERKSKTEFLAGINLLQNRPGPIRLRLQDPQGDEDQFLHEVMLNYITVRKGREKSVVTQDGLCELTFSKESLFKTIFIRALTRNRGTEKLTLESKIYRIEPVDVPLSHFVTVRIRAEAPMAAPEQVALYRRTPGEEWQYIGRESSTNGSVGSRSRELGEFALIRDQEAPLITHLTPVEGARLTQRKPLLQGTLYDPLSGISREENYRLLLDDEPAIAEYDPEGNRLFYQLEVPLAPGRHTIELIASDRCGNQSRKKNHFWIQ